MEQKDISHVYTEEELVDILSYPYQLDEMDKLELHVTAVCKLLKEHDNLNMCSDKYVEDLFKQTYSLEINNIFTATSSWIKNLAGSIYNKLPAFVDGIDKLLEYTGNGIKSIFNKRKDKQLSEEYLRERFKKLDEYRELAKNQQTCFVEDAIDYKKQLSRFEGITAVCKSIIDMAEAEDIEGFASDRLWDQLASQSNGVVKAAEPVEGSQFRRFIWIKPFTKQYDFKKSDWMKVTSTNEMLKMVLKVKYDAFDDLVRAQKYLQKLCGTLKQKTAEVQHVRRDNLEEMSVSYARTFIVAKVVTDIQKIILKEINYFVTTGIDRLGSFDKEREPRSYEFGKFKNK